MKDGGYRKLFDLIPDGEGATSVYCSLDDWVQYEKLLSGQSPYVLSTASVARLYTPYIKTTENARFLNYYGYGWNISQLRTEKDTINYIHHNGGILGTRTYRRMFTDQNIVTVFFYAAMPEEIWSSTQGPYDSVLIDVYDYLKRIKAIALY